MPSLENRWFFIILEKFEFTQLAKICLVLKTKLVDDP